MPDLSNNCPCYSGRLYGTCCAPYLSGQKSAPTAEALMRSRYAAFATGNMPYLEATLLPEKRQSYNMEEARLWSQSSEWTGLDILFLQDGKETDTKGIVEFIAHFRQNGQNLRRYEKSRFIRQDKLWYYVDGEREGAPAPKTKTGRNDPCLCGSGKKYKKCCGA